MADFVNNRVLFYPAGSTTATRVYGQLGSFTTNTVNKGGISADSLCFPFGVALDSSDNLYVTDFGNNRVLFYPAGSTTATRVYGQLGSFTTNTANTGGISADSLFLPTRRRARQPRQSLRGRRRQHPGAQVRLLPDRTVAHRVPRRAAAE